MYDVTLDDVRERKARMEREIRQAIRSFQKDTGVPVLRVDVDVHEVEMVGGGSQPSAVGQIRTEIKL